MKHNHYFTFILVGLLAIGLTGCGGDTRYSMVEGTVTYNGEPVEGATVSFQPVSPDGESAAGMTDANGRFRLTSTSATVAGRGALPGDYRITIQKREPPPPDPIQAAFDRGEIDYDEMQRRMAARGPLATRAASRDLIPARYGQPGTSGLQETVVQGRNAFTFDLTD